MCIVSCTADPSVGGRARVLALIAAWLCVCVPVRAQAVLGTADLGSVGPAATAEATWNLRNPSAEESARVDFLVPSGYVRIEPRNAVLGPGESLAVKVSYLPEPPASLLEKYPDGVLRKKILIKSSSPELNNSLVVVTGKLSLDAARTLSPEAGCDECRKMEVLFDEDRALRTMIEEIALPEAQAETPLVPDRTLAFEYFYSPACSRCRDFLVRRVPKLEKKHGVAVRVTLRDVMTDEGLRRLMVVAAEHGRPADRLPAAANDEFYFAGEVEIENNIENAVAAKTGERPLASSVAAANQSTPNPEMPITVAVLAGAGLLDGVNPCAFSTILFLVSSLAVAGRSRRSLLAVGLSFSSGVFVSYLSVGMGAFAVFSRLESFPLIAGVVRGLLVAALLAFAAISFRDYRLAAAGRAGEMGLRLPGGIAKDIRERISVFRRGAGIGGGFSLGAIIAWMELGCTGQIYLPVIAATARRGNAAYAFGYLMVYNLAFIVPLLIVLVFALRGLGALKMAAYFRKKIPLLKLLSSGLFTALAIGIAVG